MRAFLIVSLLALTLAAARHVDPVKQGLTGRYFFALDSQTAPVRTTVDAPPSSERFASAWVPPVPQTFSATWDGGLLVLRAGTYTFATVSDDASRVFVDGTLVVDNGGAHAPQQRTGSVFLERGVHAVFIDYNQQGGSYHLEWLWAREGETLVPVPAWRLAARRTSVWRFLASTTVWHASVIANWLLVAMGVFAGGGWLRRRAVRVRTRLARDGSWSVLRWILIGSLAMNGAGIWWGLPGNWPPAEPTPKLVGEAEALGFANGWHDTYPPFHFYVMSAANLPVRLLQWTGWMPLNAELRDGATLLMFRLVSLLFSAGIVVSVWWLGRRAFGKRAGLWGAACFALVAPFVYYAKTANTDVPYLFWFALSMVFYIRILDALRMRDFLLFALTATLSVCSKDQAYGMYALMPIPIAYQLWREHRRAGRARPLLGAMFDRRLWAAAGTAAVVFAACHNLLFNWRGFRAHLDFIVGPGSVDYQLFAPTIAGQIELLRLTLWLIQQSLAWPLTIACLAGLVLAFRTSKLREVSVWLLVPALSYYLTFLAVILYNYDRFVLPICLVLAPFAGFAIDRFMTWRPLARPLRVTAVTIGVAYMVLYCAAIDVLMIGDSRYVIEKWLAARVQRGDRVASTFAPDYLPRLYRFNYSEIRSIEELQTERPTFYVLNVDYARAVPSDDPTGQLVAGLHQGTLGYRRVFEYRRESPWPWLIGAHHDLVGPRLERRVSSILRNVNPTTAIFQREENARAAPR
jgi:4-amino-4-deoxy-L-arabinose transferase-like glycosyltransferase